MLRRLWAVKLKIKATLAYAEVSAGAGLRLTNSQYIQHYGNMNGLQLLPKLRTLRKSRICAKYPVLVTIQNYLKDI